MAKLHGPYELQQGQIGGQVKIKILDVRKQISCNNMASIRCLRGEDETPVFILK